MLRKHRLLSDIDGDDLIDWQEVNLTHTNPSLKDSDDNGTDDAEEDPDDDGLNKLAEINQYGTDPLDDDRSSAAHADQDKFAELCQHGVMFSDWVDGTPLVAPRNHK